MKMTTKRIIINGSIFAALLITEILIGMYAHGFIREYIGERDPAMMNVLDVYVSESMKNGCSDKAQIYVLSAVLNFNHPHSSAVIVDTETGKVQLSQVG